MLKYYTTRAMKMKYKDTAILYKIRQVNLKATVQE
jgi:hypothetical protein